ncbi:MAG: MBL fold metallo-hydrolase [Pseudolabrys sp.]|nr:MBL fold metallo-hydrolase [Pseudolabrys sp.]
MTLTFTILGCGSSMGVPRVALGWGECDPNNPKNRRRRCSLLVERKSSNGVTRVLVDCSPDLREQLLAAEVDDLDAVLITHEHADHTHGLDDLRPLFVRNRRQVPIYMSDSTSAVLHRRFRYVFEKLPETGYPPIGAARGLVPGQPVTIDGKGGPIDVVPILQDHGDIASLGFRFGNVAYSADIKRLPEPSIGQMAGLDVWIVDALRITPHPSHMNLAEALEWIARIGPKRAILTNLHADLDYATLRRQLPAHVEPGFDQQQFLAQPIS